MPTGIGCAFPATLELAEVETAMCTSRWLIQRLVVLDPKNFGQGMCQGLPVTFFREVLNALLEATEKRSCHDHGRPQCQDGRSDQA